MSTGRERERALWASKYRAYQELASRHRDEFNELRNACLEAMGEPPVDERRGGA